MYFYQLRTFLVVARHQGISRALSELALTQSAASRQIQNLEEQLGVQLFLRKGRALLPTEAGRVLQEYATRSLQILDDARQAIDGLKGLVRGRLRISAASTIGIFLLPEVLGEFKALYPGIEISLSITNKEQVLGHVLAAAADLGFVGPPVVSRELLSEEYLEDELVLVVSPRHRLADREKVRSAELLEEVFILREKGSGTREIMEEEMGRVGVPMRKAMELGSTEAIKQAVAANLGISIVSIHSVTQEALLGRLCLVRVSDLDLRRRIYMVSLRDMPLGPAAEGFRKFLFEHRAKQEARDSRPRAAPREPRRKSRAP
jgi:LysR family transcriptional regulator, low CO2-responsive transcriptional regulator